MQSNHEINHEMEYKINSISKPLMSWSNGQKWSVFFIGLVGKENDALFTASAKETALQVPRAGHRLRSKQARDPEPIFHRMAAV